MEDKFTGTGATASLVSGCVAPGGGVLGPLVGVLNKYHSDSSGISRGAIKAVPGISITAVFGGANKAPPGGYDAMIFLSVASVLGAMVIFC